MSTQIRPILIEGNTARVILTQGYSAIIDASDVSLVSRRNWYAWVGPSGVYAVHCKNRHTVRMHRIIMGNPQGLQIDHIDMNGLNNRRGNLRVATRSQNKCNMAARADNSSGLKGAHLSGQPGRWKSTITIGGKRTSLGVYDTPEEAHAAYCNAVSEHHKEFARTAINAARLLHIGETHK